MNKTARQPLPLYDDPKTYSQFDGGINNDLSSGNLIVNELRNATNCSYNNRTLEKRLGAQLYKDLQFAEENPDDQQGLIQGHFTLTGFYNTYYIVARDGKLYFSLLDVEETLMTLQELVIVIDDDLYTQAITDLYTEGVYNNNNKYSESNILAGLTLYGVDDDLPNPFLSNEGYVYTKDKVTDTNYLISSLDDSTSSGLYIEKHKRLMFQNYKPIAGSIYDNTLYLATGTRLLKVFEVSNGTLQVEIVAPKQLNAWEIASIGSNYLSPYPERMVASSSETSNTIMAMLKVHTYQTVADKDITIEALIDYAHGKDSSDYWFKWEIKKANDSNGEWEVYSNFSRDSHLAVITLSLDQDNWANTDKLSVKCTLVEGFITKSDLVIPEVPVVDEAALRTEIRTTNDLDNKTLLELTTLCDESDITYSDDNTSEELRDIIVEFLYDRDGPIGIYNRKYSCWLESGLLNEKYWKPDGVVHSILKAVKDITLGVVPLEPNRKFLEIHTCNKILADGNKIILYGTPYRSANWYKSAVNQFDYFSDQGQLDFQTNKNESIIACEHLDGNIIVFADNEHLGGSIHKVTGNGDDYNDGNYYSPYQRHLIHNSISCDHPNSVQYVDNFIVFKYRDTFWQLESRELNLDRVQLLSISDNVNHNNPELEMPRLRYHKSYEFDLFSYVDEDTYTVVYPKQNLQYKMYYKLGSGSEHNNSKLFYPWLRDTTELLDCQGVIKIRSVPTYISKGFKLIQFIGKDYTDLGDVYKTTIAFKAFDLDNPGMVKYLNEVIVNYHRGATDTFKMLLRGYNEASYQIAGPKVTAFVDHKNNSIVYDYEGIYYPENADNYDKPNLYLGKIPLNDAILNIHLLYNRVYVVNKKFPFLNVSITLDIESRESFSLDSLIFNFMSTDMPPQNLPLLYEKIIRE